MSKRDALKALSQRFPLPEQTGEVITSLLNKGDRELVIVTGALVESCLERAIIRHLNLSNPDLIGQLFKNRGPMSDFHSKILVAQALGFLTMPSLALEMKLVKNVRNAFAHSILPIDFVTKEVIDEIEASDLARQARVHFVETVQSYDAEEAIIARVLASLGPRDSYLSIVRITCSLRYRRPNSMIRDTTSRSLL